jgi:K(+)-stimulated pyrophosphate-energized sodium pump
MEGTGKPEYDKCVAISTEASIKKMMLPGAIAIVSPLIIGFLLGPEALGGFLAGATVSGVLMGMFQNNAGGAWDNAKKSFEKGVEINGQTYYKKSEPHKASVTGDTVGDPFKDTSGPSMNILIKLMSIVSLVIAPTLAQIHKTDAADRKGPLMEQVTEIKVLKDSTDNTVTSSDNVASDQPVADEFAPLVDAVRRDGLATGDNVSIKYRDGILTVNGKEQPAEVAKKYEPLFHGKTNFEVKVKK